MDVIFSKTDYIENTHIVGLLYNNNVDIHNLLGWIQLFTLPILCTFISELMIFSFDFRLELQIHHYIGLFYYISIFLFELNSSIVFFVVLQVLFSYLEFPIFIYLFINSVYKDKKQLRKK